MNGMLTNLRYHGDSECSPLNGSVADDIRSGNEAYGKNLRIQMGRCPVRSIFPEALKMLQKKQHLLG